MKTVLITGSSPVAAGAPVHPQGYNVIATNCERRAMWRTTFGGAQTMYPTA